MEKKGATHNLGERIKELRLANKMTQSSLAAKLYMSDKVISKWEKGKSIPDVDILLDLSEIFDVSIEYLLTGKTNSPKSKGARIIYNDDGTIAQYIGVDGHRLFTKDEVNTILNKRMERYQKSIYEKYGIQSSEELEDIISSYFIIKKTLLENDKVKNKRASSLNQLVDDLKAKL